MDISPELAALLKSGRPVEETLARLRENPANYDNDPEFLRGYIELVQGELTEAHKIIEALETRLAECEAALPSPEWLDGVARTSCSDITTIDALEFRKKGRAYRAKYEVKP